MIHEATASTFVFARLSSGWHVGLIEHPRLGKKMLPGGHVENFETAAEAALREVTEETGRNARLLSRPFVPAPDGFPFETVPMPWLITRQAVVADNHCAEPHVHVDHQFVAVADAPHDPVAEPVHPFAWHSASEVDTMNVIADTRLLARELFTRIEDLESGNLSAWTSPVAERS